MKYEILKSPTGKRWGRLEGSGIIAELRERLPDELATKPKKRTAK